MAMAVRAWLAVFLVCAISAHAVGDSRRLHRRNHGLRSTRRHHSGSHLLEAHVVYDEQHHHYLVSAGHAASRQIAWGSYHDTISSNGWGVLNVHTSSSFDPSKQAFAAGYLEGFLTSSRIHEMFLNAHALHDPKSIPGLYRFFEVQDRYLRAQVANHASSSSDDKYWRHVDLVLTQLDGLLAGYNKHCVPANKLTMGDLWLLNMDGDAMDVERALLTGKIEEKTGRGIEADKANPVVQIVPETAVGAHKAHSSLAAFKETNVAVTPLPHQPRKTQAKKSSLDHSNSRFRAVQAAVSSASSGSSSGSSHEREWMRLMRHSRCSALIKMTASHDVLVAHTTWADYGELLRIYKHYDMPLGGDIKATRSSFSSYPGMLSSTDDFMLLSSRLAVIETTTNVNGDDPTPYATVSADSGVASWVRVLVANRLADSGRSWSRLFSRYNSGTYNCQWLVVDHKRVTPGGAPPTTGAFWVLEQMPDYVEARDMTAALVRRTYWPSLNRPFFRAVREKGMYPAEDPAKSMDFFSFENNPRGHIMKREHHTVKDVQSMKRLMQYNDYKSDPFSSGKPGYAIAPRFDLYPTGDLDRRANGAIDSKIASHADVLALRSTAISGPTHQQQAPFSFTASGFEDVVRHGVPDRWNFDWVTMQPDQPSV